MDSVNVTQYFFYLEVFFEDGKYNRCIDVVYEKFFKSHKLG